MSLESIIKFHRTLGHASLERTVICHVRKCRQFVQFIFWIWIVTINQLSTSVQLTVNDIIVSYSLLRCITPPLKDVFNFSFNFLIWNFQVKFILRVFLLMRERMINLKSFSIYKQLGDSKKNQIYHSRSHHYERLQILISNKWGKSSLFNICGTRILLRNQSPRFQVHKYLKRIKSIWIIVLNLRESG